MMAATAQVSLIFLWPS